MKARVALLASLFSLCLVAMVAAQVTTTTGTVVSNSGGSLVVDTASGQRTFMVDAQSSLPANLAPGTRVTVEYHTLANDQFHAFKVTTMGTSPTTTTTDTAMAPPADTMTAPAPAPAAPTMAAPTTPPASTTQERPTTTTTPTDTTSTTGTTMDDDTATNRTLPATASPLPLLALAGSLALAGGLLLRRRRA